VGRSNAIAALASQRIELGYVISGAIEVILWRSPGESAVFTLTAGMCCSFPSGFALPQ